MHTVFSGLGLPVAEACIRLRAKAVVGAELCEYLNKNWLDEGGTNVLSPSRQSCIIIVFIIS